MDLSSDGRWALVASGDMTELTALPTGVGQPRSMKGNGLEFALRGGRWAPDGKSVLVGARASASEPFTLRRLFLDGSPPASVSPTPLAGEPFLHVSRDGRWAAAHDAELRTVLISLQDGSTRLLPLGRGELVIPHGFSREGHLWVTVGGRAPRARIPLLRLDPRTDKILEERSIGPADPGGTTPIRDVVLSDDGREMAFTFGRYLSRLYLLRGLGD